MIKRQNMRKNEMIVETSEKCHLPFFWCYETVTVLLSILAPMAALCAGSVEIRGFGTFRVRDKRPRPARNPKTGAIVMIPARRVFLFRYSPDLAEMAVQGAHDFSKSLISQGNIPT